MGAIFITLLEKESYVELNDKVWIPVLSLSKWVTLE